MKLIELQQKILEMQGTLANFSRSSLEVQQDNRELKDRQRGFDDDAAFRDSLKYDERLGVWHRTIDGIKEAYCGDCLNEGKRSRLRGKKGGDYCCHIHGYRR